MKLSPVESIKDDLNIGNGSQPLVLKAVHDAGVKIIPDDRVVRILVSIYNLLSNTKSRQTEEDQVAALVKAQDFDGIDIDFEAMSPATRPYYSLFIEGVSRSVCIRRGKF